jgi:hypothetical protein
VDRSLLAPLVSAGIACVLVAAALWISWADDTPTETSDPEGGEEHRGEPGREGLRDKAEGSPLGNRHLTGTGRRRRGSPGPSDRTTR